jgi:hypothetical protein
LDEARPFAADVTSLREAKASRDVMTVSSKDVDETVEGLQGHQGDIAILPDDGASARRAPSPT